MRLALCALPCAPCSAACRKYPTLLVLASHHCCIVAAFQASKPGLIGQLPRCRPALSAFDSASVASCSSAVQQHRMLLQPVEIVLTAHPTQVMRRSLQHKQCRIGQLLHDLDRAAADASTAGTAAKDEVVNTIFREVMATWQTDEIRRNKPTPVEEAKSGLNILEQSLWTAIPAYASPLLPDPARAPTGVVPTVAETAATPVPETRRGQGAFPGTVQGSRPGVPVQVPSEAERRRVPGLRPEPSAELHADPLCVMDGGRPRR